MKSLEMNSRNTIPAQQYFENKAILAIVATIGVIFGFGGIAHGIFEVLQGNTATNGLVIDAIGEHQRMWVHGYEPAFTIIPNFLITGIAAITVGIAIIIWSVGFMHTKHASTIFLSLFILLFLVGGGIAQILFFMIGWGMSTRLHKPLDWWRKRVPEGFRSSIAKLWSPSLVVGSFLILFTLQIAIFGYVPGIPDPDKASMAMVIMPGAGLLLLILAFVFGCAYDSGKGGASNAQ
ncbi:MAG: hypothetical protein CVV48_09830 [Spirochaetae bacterium HGW-Spirochaetae-4]|jgi:hypothetical protein|nr:MAG: hypothetical protein CVV48_09830 [Spirochaetae bacterium HGW-Spirochaetae-4]